MKNSFLFLCILYLLNFVEMFRQDEANNQRMIVPEVKSSRLNFTLHFQRSILLIAFSSILRRPSMFNKA